MAEVAAILSIEEQVGYRVEYQKVLEKCNELSSSELNIDMPNFDYSFDTSQSVIYQNYSNIGELPPAIASKVVSLTYQFQTVAKDRMGMDRGDWSSHTAESCAWVFMTTSLSIFTPWLR